MERKILGEYHDLYVQSNILLSAVIHYIYEFDPAKFISAPGLVWQAVLKKD